jgi:hypothetical protein
MSAPPADQPPWYTLTAEAAEKLQVDPVKGLSTAEAQQRLQQYGPNRLADDQKIPGWRRCRCGKSPSSSSGAASARGKVEAEEW